MNDERTEDLLRELSLRPPSSRMDRRIQGTLSQARRRIPIWKAAAAALAAALLGYGAGRWRSAFPEPDSLPLRVGEQQVQVWLVPREQASLFDLTPPRPALGKPDGSLAEDMK